MTEPRGGRGAHVTVRMFVSSTFADFVEERRVLHDGLPATAGCEPVRSPLHRLQTHARDRGAGFEVVDLRWGVSRAAASAHLTMDRCLTELDRACRTPGPSVLALIGERYGWQPVPRVLHGTDLAALCAVLTPADRATAAAAYRREDNHAPVAHLLREDVDEDRLRHVLAAACATLGWSTHSAAGLSATEQEVRRALAASAPDRPRVLAYLRTFAPDGAEPPGALGRLRHDLRDHHAVATRELRVDRGEYGAGLAREYLSAFADRVVSDVVPHLDAAVDALLEASDREARVHLDLASRHRRSFRGRETEQRALVDHLARPAVGPLVVTGPGGVGKSALLAVVPGTGVVVRRHVGASPESGSGAALAAGIAAELGCEPGEDVWDGLRAGLSAADRTTVVVDGLDMLPAEDEFLRFRWLPETWPEGLRLLMSSRDENHVRLLRLRRAAVERLDLAPPDLATALALFDDLLRARRRTVTPGQRAAVVAALGRCTLPLFVSILAGIASGWSAGERVRIDVVDTVGAAASAFDALAAPDRHGPELVATTLGLLAASRFGLSDDEVVDALSDDNELMAAFRARHAEAPYAVRLPYVVWSSLRDDLATYLAERSVDGVDVVDFLHREFRAVAGSYPPSSLGSTVAGRHGRLAAVFRRHGTDRTGTWVPTARRAASEAAHHLLAAGDGEAVDALLARADHLAAAVGRTRFLAGVSRPRRPATGDLVRHLRARGHTAVAEQVEAGAEVLAVRPTAVVGIVAASGFPVRGRVWGETELRRAGTVPEYVADHGNVVTTMAVSADGEFLATGDEAGYVAWRPISDPRPTWLRSGHGAWVTALAVTPDGRTLVSAGDDGRIVCWDTASGRGEAMPLSPSVVARPQASHLAMTGPTTFVAFVGARPLRGDIETGEVWTAPETMTLGGLLSPHDVDPVAHDPTGRWRVERARRPGGSMLVRDLATGEALIETSERSAAAGAAVQADGRLLLSTTGGLELCDLTTPDRSRRRAPGPVLTSLDTDGDGFVGLDDRRRVVRVGHDLRAGVVAHPERPPSGAYPHLVRFLPGTGRVALGWSDGGVSIHALDDGRCTGSHRAAPRLAGGVVARDGRTAVGWFADLPDVVRCAPGRAPETLRSPHRRRVVGAADSGTGEFLTLDASGLIASWSGGSKPDVWDAALPASCLGELPTGPGAIIGSVDGELHHVGPVPATLRLDRGTVARRPFTAVHADAAVVSAVMDSGWVVRTDGERVVWRPDDDERRPRIAGTAVSLTAHGMADGNMDGSLRVWHPDRVAPVWSWTGAHRGPVTWIGRIGGMLLTASGSGSVFVVDPDTGEVHAAAMVVGGVVAGRVVDTRTVVLLRADGALVTYRLEEPS